MGRRPDALIAQYFARGAKIGDASNRYEYTCSRCGAHFPKGRRETLNAHLTKKCPSVSEAERIEIGWRLLDLPAPNEDNIRQKGATVNPGSGTSSMVASSSSTTIAQDVQRQQQQQQQQQNFNGLNVLAEASRQVGGNNSSGYTPADQAQTAIVHANEDADTTTAVYHSSPRQSQSHQQPEAQQHGLPLDPQLSEDAFTQQLLLHADGMSGVARNNDFSTLATSPLPPTTTAASSTTASFPGLYSFTSLNNHDQLHAVTTQGQEFTTSSLTSTHPSPDLSSIAASANATLAGHMTEENGNGNDISMTDHDVSEALLEELREQTQALPQTSTSLTWAPTTLLGPHAMDVEHSSSDQTHTDIQPDQQQNPTNGIEAQVSTTTTVPGTRLLLPAGPIPTNSNSNSNSNSTLGASRPTSTTTHFVAETGTLAKVQKPKVRGRFDDTRRKEVRELRKLGACLRCRMLKKTCSPGTPCQTCAAVETPRVWKHCCVRTKLVDAFPLYFNLIYGGVLHKRLEHLKQRSETLYDSNAHLVAWYIPEQKIRLRVQKRKLKQADNETNGNGPAGAAALQSSLLVANPEYQQDNSNNIIFHIHTEDVNVFDVDQLLRPLREHIIAQEKSDVIKSTVAVAQALQTGAISMNGNNNDTTTASPPSIFSVEKNDNLLDRVIELWTATALLTNPEVRPNFMLEQDNTDPNHNNNNHNHTPAAANGAQSSDSGSGTDDGGIMVEGDAYAHSRALMTLQLQAAVEKRADKLARVVMNHLEQRLLERNRNRNQSVEIVLVAFILLNCAERMCWLYRVWASEQDAQAKSGQLAPTAPTTTTISTSIPGPWPLYKPAGDFADKGEYFAGIIHLLLNLRQFEPSVTVDPTSGFLAPKDPNDTALAAWLNNSFITRDWVLEATKKGTAVADPEHCTSLDGTLCARLL
ncbi:hypothetical protein HRR83_008941 [Exophiala dermatitidis]|uniref:Uncharacterized protein n=1 Tax=Exophiala dermatitidis TaxID=5970 RepID=A0AAN6EM59_EXODE|nr:hypothetical protein HRR75_008160 [Exophiala dermatitidis]KAJ4504236.1 hypothetical protein HRR73_008792 [Exophiala dermatitidis]KAJ4504617.1 hypothetical protein HRR74_008883 [Exophiala dermatitidis]KAJ4533495.1 hypothetical protein HRR77_008473 [Exophiala dermatitidis]KAJ4538561.1 hypothetical protein HRR78_008093 [Exophiala dermatitidis]